MSSSTWSSSPSTWYDWSYPDDDQSSTSPPSVKEEPDDAPGRFIMEISPPQATSSLISQSLAPPTEVPLRATQASSDMRRMMTVFRLNPFAIHSGEGPMVPAAFESAHPLDTEPITFEFQLDIEPGILDPESPVALNHPDLRSFSPDFDLHEKLPTTHWRDFSHDVSSEHSSTPPPPTQGIQSWDISYPDVEDNFSSINLSGYHQPMSPRRSQRLHNSVSPSYLHQQKATTTGDSIYSSSSSSTGLHHHYPHTSSSTSPSSQSHSHTHHHNDSRLTPQQEALTWGHQSQSQSQTQTQLSSLRSGVGYHTCSAAASRSQSNAYSDSTINSLRRWSLPDAHVHPAPAQFFAM